MAKKSKKTAKRAGKTAKRATKVKAKKVKTSRVKSKSKSKPKPKRKSKTRARGASRIGFVVAPGRADWQDYTDAFEDRLKAKGWTIGNGTGARDVFIDYEPGTGAMGDPALISIYANQFVQNGVDVIVTAGTEASLICKNAISNNGKHTPLVFASVGDPVGCGLVASLANTPGSNVTGCANMQTDAGVLNNRINKMINRLNPKKVGIIGNNNPIIYPINAAIDLAYNALTALKIPVATKALGYFAPGDFQDRPTLIQKLQPLDDEDVDVLLVISDPVLTTHVDDLIKAAHHFQMKTMHEFREPRDHHGGNQTYGPNFAKLFRKAAEHVDQILRGADPGSIRVFQPNTFEQDPP